MKYFILITLSGLINFIAWNYFGILFIASIFILFYISKISLRETFIKRILILFLFHIVLNITVTFWLFEVDKFDALIIYFTNSLLFLIISIPLILHNFKYRYPFFILVWIIGEILLSKWDLAWPWLNFGNVMGNQWYFIQWYSFFGVYSGSLWILATAYFIFKINIKQNFKRYLILLISSSFFPIFSWLYYTTNMCKIQITEFEKVTCYIPKNKNSNYSETKKIYNYIVNNNIDNTFITTELFYTDVYSNYLNKNSALSNYYNELFKIRKKLNFIIGTEIKNDTIVRFNGVTCFNKNNIFFRTKKKYVPINEYTTPILRPIFGSTFYTKNYIDDTSRILKLYNTIPFVCYESIFSDFVASFNSNKIIVIASESFLGNNNYGKKQYLNILRIRAIENKKYLLKSSFKGYSALINPNGKISVNFTKEFETVNLPIVKEKTFYQMIIQSL